MTRTVGGLGANHFNAGIPANHFIKAKAEIHSFNDCLVFMDNGRAVEKDLGSNVTVRLDARDHGGRPEAYAVVLYLTPIVIYHADGTWEADNGGYNTPTTSTRLNQFGPRGFHFSHERQKLWAFPCGEGLRIFCGGHLTTAFTQRFLERTLERRKLSCRWDVRYPLLEDAQSLITTVSGRRRGPALGRG